jgi:hypothetical protein
MENRPGSKPKPSLVMDGEKYIIDDIFISELGYLMVKLYSREKKTYTTYNLGNYNPEDNFLKDAIEKERITRNSTN